MCKKVKFASIIGLCLLLTVMNNGTKNEEPQMMGTRTSLRVALADENGWEPAAPARDGAAEVNDDPLEIGDAAMEVDRNPADSGNPPKQAGNVSADMEERPDEKLDDALTDAEERPDEKLDDALTDVEERPDDERNDAPTDAEEHPADELDDAPTDVEDQPADEFGDAPESDGIEGAADAVEGSGAGEAEESEALTQALDEEETEMLVQEIESEAIIQDEPQCYIDYLPSSLQFMQIFVSDEPQIVGRQEDIWMIRVMDTFVGGSDWKLYATADDLVSTDGTDRLAAMLMFITEGDVRRLTADNQMLIASRPFGAQVGLTTLVWAEKEGPHLFVDPNAGMPGKSYGTTITWILEIGP